MTAAFYAITLFFYAGLPSEEPRYWMLLSALPFLLLFPFLEFIL